MFHMYTNNYNDRSKLEERERKSVFLLLMEMRSSATDFEMIIRIER